jgi:thymidylate kinase
MSNPVFHSSSLNVLSRLICPEGTVIIVFDPDRLLVRDESFCFSPEGSFMGLLRRMAETDPANTCLFNLSDMELAVSPPRWLIEFNGSYDYSGMESLDWSVVNNPDGSPRWIYPSTLRRPIFLAFYNFNYRKARLYKFLVKMVFFLRMPALVRNGRMTIHHRAPVQVETLVAVAGRDYAIFTGTVGPNRKIVVAEGGGREPSSFLKIPLGDRSAANIENEYQALCLLRHIPMKGVVVPKVSVVVPKVSKAGSGAIRLSNIKPVRAGKDRNFGHVHYRFLRNLLDASFDRKFYRQTEIASETHERLRRLASHPRLGERGRAQELFNKLVALESRFQATNPMIGLSMSHGDFTPWNVYSSGDSLFVYDWELCRQDMPVLFDLFHYVIQGKVFAVNASAPELQAELDKLLDSPIPAWFLRERGLDPALYLRLYLLHNAAYYLEIYLSQEVLHENGYRLFSAWSDLLGGVVVAAVPKGEMRKVFVRSFFRRLKTCEYTVLKSAGKSMQDLALESDLDILIGSEDAKQAMDWIRHYPGVEKLLCMEQSFMTTMQLFFTDHSFLSIDLLTAFHRKSLEYIPAAAMLEHAEMVNGVRILPPAYEYLYIYLFYQLNSAAVPLKYTRCFEGMDLREEKGILEVLQQQTGVVARRLSHTFAFSAVRRREAIAYLRSKPENHLSARLRRWGRYVLDQSRGLFRVGGIMLSFSGVDGAGKSTILGEVRDLLEQKYRRKVVVLRHRPSVLPILSAWKYGKEAAEQKCVDSLPRKGNNKSQLSSALRFAYYYTDYLLGQLLIYVKYMLRGYVVLYDRYYFDFVVDGKRSNILISPRFIRQLYRFVYKPQLNVFLYAAPEIILKRKQELSAEDIVQLTDQYKILFDRLGSQQRYICIENMDKQATIDRIEQAYIQLN